MLTQQENERLTQVGAGTPMGELMRRYWHPVAAAAELDERPTKGGPAARRWGESGWALTGKRARLGVRTLRRLAWGQGVAQSYPIALP